MRYLLGIAVAMVLLAGCSAHSGPAVATAHRPTGVGASASPTASAKETDYDKAVQYTRCMTDHGTKMSDPEVGKALQTGDPVTVGGGWQVMTNAAFEKCKQFLPATWPVYQDPADIARDKPFFECMRKRGIDLGEVGPDGFVHYPADPSYQETPAYQSAEAACRYLVDDPANNQ
jgi:hypothetical protein